MSETPEITIEMTMEEILRRLPSAQRALFQRYHIGGCSSCAFQPTDTLAQVCADHNILDPAEVVAWLLQAQELDERIQLDPSAVKAFLDAGEDFDLLDVRATEELALARLSAAEPLDTANSQHYMELPKDRKLVFLCKTGDKSLNVAAYFIGHGFTNIFSVRGGLDAWRTEIDPSIPTYELASPGLA